ncbi:hypothetical protein [Haloarcula sp. 1CSR25-25]|jgi:hypothetical protein|uniref:hypothetical protein n=1 Tax=Haloarcula sp. 1CSR25-25 TaxID=2862545 RepID=UPI0028945F8B|nr:hypothetical protein [Haloarcula sp. 1CSR25-25]MDT3436480.1 hypothetical protein [Haloarcula sp. 1CSR25-25]
MATEQSTSRLDAATVLGYLRTLVYTLVVLLAFSLLVVGTIGLIAELKGSWHWAIHLESTISYVGLFVSRLLVVLVPLFVVLVVGRRVVPDA